MKIFLWYDAFEDENWELKLEKFSFLFCMGRRSWMSIFQDNKSTILVEELNRFLKMIFFLFCFLFFPIQKVWIVFYGKNGWIGWINGMSERVDCEMANVWRDLRCKNNFCQTSKLTKLILQIKAWLDQKLNFMTHEI